jgi:very-short-patch-repair endonuclease
MAGALAFGDDAVLSHRTAAALWGLSQRNAWKLDITVPTWRRSRAGFWVHCSQLEPTELTREDGIPVTTVARTLFDLAGVVRRDQLVRAVEEAERRQLFDLRAVEAVLARKEGRPGAPTLRSVLSDYQGPADVRSELEHRFVSLLRRSRLPTPQINVLVAGFEVDFLWPQYRLVVELDGRAYHTSPRAFERDRLRDAKLQRAGYRVLRVTHGRLRDDPAGILEDIAELAA